jgi:hypothetical protein
MYRSMSHIRPMCKHIWIPGKFTLSFMIGSDSDRSAFKVRPLGPHRAMSIFAHYDNLQGCADLAISVPDWCKELTSDHMYGQWINAYKKQGAPDWRSITSILYFLHVQRRVQNVRSSWLTSLNSYLMLFTRTAPRTKSKGLPIHVP